MTKLEELKKIYPGALAWQFRDSPELADELVQLVLSGSKTATCSSIASFQHEHERGEAPCVGSYNIILNGAGQPMCVIRTLRMQVIRFNEVTSELASKEGEGDLSLEYWNEGKWSLSLRNLNLQRFCNCPLLAQSGVTQSQGPL